MLVTQCFQTTFPRASTIDQVFNHQISRAFNRQLRQRHRGSQQLSGISHRERGQIISTELASQFRVTWMPLPPLQFGLGHKPRRQADQRQFVFPGGEFLGAQFIPAYLTFGVTVGAFDEDSLAFAPSQSFKRCLGRFVRERVMDFTFPIAAHDQPFFNWLLSVLRSPPTTGAELVLEMAAFGGSDFNSPPDGFRQSRNLSDFHRFVLAQDSRLSLAAAFQVSRDIDYWPFQIDLCVDRNISAINQMGLAQLSTQPKTAPVKRVATDHFKAQALAANSLDHLPPQLNFSRKLAIGRDSQSLPLFGHLRRKPTFGQKQLSVDPHPVAVVSIGQKGPDLAHINLAQTPIVLSSCSDSFLRRLLISAFIQDQSAAFGKGWFLRDFFADLLQDLLSGPRRIGHKMLHILRRLSERPRDIAEIAFCGHSQQPAEKAQGVMTYITRRSFKTFGIAFPELIQTLAENFDLGARQSPSAGVKNFAFFLILGADTHLFGVPAIQLFLNCLTLFFRSAQM